MTALVRMRVSGFLRGGRALPPLIAVLVVLGVIHGGGPSPAGSAYGYSAVALFPVFTWLTKLVLDTEPDAQRRLARLAVGARREAAAGLLTAVVPGILVCALAMAAPWPFGAIRGPRDPEEAPLAVGMALGVLAHLLSLTAALAVGALSGRAVTRTVRNGVTVLVTGSLLVIVLGLSGSAVPWLVPPMMAMARALSDGGTPPARALVGIVAWSFLWCAAVFSLYGRLRRARS